MDLLHEELAESDLCKNSQSYDLNGLLRCYNNTLMSVIDRQALVITKTVTKRLIVPWFTREVKLAKRERRRVEKQWRRTMLHSDFLIFKAKKNHATFIMKKARKDYYTDFIQELSTDQRKLFRCAKSLFDQQTDLTFQGYNDCTVLENDIGNFFVQKINRIRSELDTAATISYPSEQSRSTCTATTASLESFLVLSEDDVSRLIMKSIKKSCTLDPMPTPPCD